MKNNIKKIAGLMMMLIITLLTGCKQDFLSQIPDDRITIEEVFQRRHESERYLANIYSRLRDEWNQFTDSPWLGAADEVDVTWARDNMITHHINMGSWNSGSFYAQYWGHYYQGIRSATYFMEHIGGNEEILRLGNEGVALIDQYRAEARFLRAWFYFCLVRQYGPVIVLPELIDPDAPLSEIQIPRSSYDECIQYIVDEMDAAAQILQLQVANDRDEGRITRAVCMAAKSRVLLYAASPMNNGNTEFANFKNLDGKALYNQSYDENKWRLAAEAAKSVIDLPIFTLYKVYDQSGVLDPLLSYRNTFLEPFNSEQIFVRPIWNHGEWEKHSSPRFGGGFSGVGVTQKQVDAYFMANGKAREESGSGYVETGFSSAAGKYTRAGTFNMYVNREPRFYASVVYNNSLWINRSEGERVVELHRTGNTGMQGTVDYSRTGYLVKKNIHPNALPRLNQSVRRPYAYIRLAEIYLNYAEALNEYDPGNTDIAKYVNLVRERAGLPGLPTGIEQDDMRRRIQQERQVELAFETHRWFDVRRWKIAHETDGGPFSGMNVEAGASVSDASFYQRTVFENRIFRQAYYLWPLPLSEMDRNDFLVQNPGW